MRIVSSKVFLFPLMSMGLGLGLSAQDAIPSVGEAAPGADAASAANKSPSETIAVSSGYEEATSKYASEPVEATQINGPNQYSPITLLDLSAGGLVFRYPNLDSPITIPEDQLTFAVGYRPKLDSERYSQLVGEGKNDQALELVRQEVYPLLKYVPVDPQTIRIHALVTRLLDELIAAGEINEAASILESFPRDRLTGYFRPQAVQVASLLVVNGEIDRAYDLVKKFPLGPGQLEFAQVYLNLANEFRLREEWERSRNLYKDVQLSSSPNEIPEAFLWEAYIHLQEGRDFMVDGILDQFGSFDTNNPYFSLRELVRGAMLSKRGEDRLALSTLAKGLVYSTTNDPWTPELLYRTADLYEAEDFVGAASEIRDQLRFFYPDSVWASRLPESNR